MFHFFFFSFQWLRGSFYRKEKILKEFYENNENDKNSDDNKVGNSNDNDDNKNNGNTSLKNWPPLKNIEINHNKPLLYVSTWMFMIIYFLLKYSYFRWCIVILIITCVAISSLNGFDSVEMALHGNMVISEALASHEAKKDKKVE
jgi:hypothetical protein